MRHKQQHSDVQDNIVEYPRHSGLTFGPGCGWTFDIQVDANTEVLNLVDVNNGSANVLAGIAIHEGPIFQ